MISFFFLKDKFQVKKDLDYKSNKKNDIRHVVNRVDKCGYYFSRDGKTLV